MHDRHIVVGEQDGNFFAFEILQGGHWICHANDLAAKALQGVVGEFKNGLIIIDYEYLFYHRLIFQQILIRSAGQANESMPGKCGAYFEIESGEEHCLSLGELRSA